MIVTSIKLFSNTVEVAEFGLSRLNLSQPYLIKSATGLDVDEITPRFYDQNSSGNLYDMAPSERNIVLRLELNPNYGLSESVSDLRDRLYRVISANVLGHVQLQFMNGINVAAVADGYITKFEAPQFTQSPYIQLSIRCIDPYFRSLTPFTYNLAGFNRSTPTITDNVSTAPHGFTYRFQFTAPQSSFSFSGFGDVDWLFVVVHSFLTNDIVTISTEINKRALTVTRGSTVTNIVDKISIDSIWPMLFPGQNRFITFSAQYNPLSFIYYQKFWGI